MKDIKCGLLLSDKEDVEVVDTLDKVSIKEYDLIDETRGIQDQGDSSICASISVVDTLYYNYKTKNRVLPKIGDDYFFNRRADQTVDGMTIREALDIAIRDGYIHRYGVVGGVEGMKSAILFNGPVIVALPVRSTGDIFWRGDRVIGYHAVTVVGFDKRGFKVRNSWGRDWGAGGYTTLLYEDFHYIIEAWTILY